MTMTWHKMLIAHGRKATASPALGAALLLVLVAGCTEAVPYSGPGTVLSETPAAANSVLSCDNLTAERSAIAATLRELAGQPGADNEVMALNERDRTLTALAETKHCP